MAGMTSYLYRQCAGGARGLSARTKIRVTVRPGYRHNADGSTEPYIGSVKSNAAMPVPWTSASRKPVHFLRAKWINCAPDSRHDASGQWWRKAAFFGS